MALGIYYCQIDKRKLAVRNLIVTVICGAIFMVIKYFEYSHKIHEGWMPGTWFEGWETIKHVVEHGMGHDVQIPSNQPLYFSFYFMMTGLHGIHVLAGMGLVTWVASPIFLGKVGFFFWR